MNLHRNSVDGLALLELLAAILTSFAAVAVPDFQGQKAKAKALMSRTSPPLDPPSTTASGDVPRRMADRLSREGGAKSSEPGAVSPRAPWQGKGKGRLSRLQARVSTWRWPADCAGRSSRRAD